jgi:GT2 family glycosyltransferase
MTTASKLEVCVGVPTLNGPDRLRRCLESVRRHTRMDALGARLFVSDDCSRPENLEANKIVCASHGVEMLMSDSRLGVAQQWNRLTRHTDAPVMVLMNDDVEVVPDWLDALAFSVRSNAHAGMVGLKAYQGVNSLNFLPPLAHSYNEAVMERGHQMISSQGFLFAFSRAKFDAVGGFDPEFFCFYEECDLGARFLAKGWPSYMLSYPVVIHQGGATTSERGNIDSQAELARSRERFKAKHGGIRAVRESMREPKAGWPKPVQWNTMLSTWVD